MTETTEHQMIEDHVLMAHTYAKGMGDVSALDESETIIKARRLDMPPEYASELRDRVTYVFMAAQNRDLGEYVRMARSLESELWADYRERNKTIDAAD